MSFSFKKEAKVFVVFLGSQYSIDISSINFNQTHVEHLYSNKTLQIPNMFEQVVINKANPATFEITFPALRETDLQILFNRALDYAAFDIYVRAGPNVFKIENCVITNFIFNTAKIRPLTLSAEGEAIRATRVGDADSYVIPGTTVPRSGTKTYNLTKYTNIKIENTVAIDNLASINIQLQNNIKWTPYTSIDDALVAIDADSSMYPREYELDNRVLQGVFSTHVIDIEFWDKDIGLLIQIGEKVGNTVYGIEFDMPAVTIQTNISTGNVFNQSYTWRMTHNPEHLSEVIKYLGLTNLINAIQDNLGVDILDHNSEAILETF